jgi:DNA-binding MurR/RpiR family transcriptional regulator
MNIDENHLNPLELQIHQKLSGFAASNDVVRIGQAAEICGCSVSKISKFVQKLGFDGYKRDAAAEAQQRARSRAPVHRQL